MFTNSSDKSHYQSTLAKTHLQMVSVLMKLMPHPSQTTANSNGMN
jgi:hypothetical protein